jgi:hypothetical protein
MDDIKGEIVIDYMGKNNGTSYGDVSQTDSGKVGKAMKFDGAKDYILVPNDPSITFNASDSFTLSTWVYLPSLPSNKWVGVISKARDTFKWYGIWASSTTDSWVFGIGNLGEKEYINLHGDDLTLGWTHVTVVQNVDDNNRSIYLNGSFDVSENETADCNGSGKLKFGGEVGSDDPFNGSIDEVMIFNKSLSDKEINWIYELQN